MRLIDTNTGDFVEITHPDKVVYAILSHTWSPEGEQSYQEILELRRTLCAPPFPSLQVPGGGNKHRPALFHGFSDHPETQGESLRAPFHSGPTSLLHHPQLSLKVKGVCKIARRHGYRYVWIDSACIDKTSSAELSEAINSMYEWYRLADVCYVYLSDVSGKDDPAGINSEFRLSRWHSRGWTLQELIAPKHVLFLTSSWSVLGSKIVLAETLEEITGIDAPVLKHFYLLESICVARRMRWASRRNTTRVEDEAYCLLGIFGIHMPPIYGEGRRAFIRLQQEILKRIPDQTLFAWGRRRQLDESLNGLRVRSSDGSSPADSWSDPSGLLAASPRAFMDCTDVLPIPTSDFADRLGYRPNDPRLPLPDYSFTAHGVCGQFPCIELRSALPELRDVLLRDSNPTEICGCEGRSFAFVHSLVILRCQTFTGDTYALPLRGVPEGSVGIHKPSCPSHTDGVRLISIGPRALRSFRPHISVQRDLTIRQGGVVSILKTGAGTASESLVRRVTVEKWCAESLRGRGFVLHRLQVERSGRVEQLSYPVTLKFSTTLSHASLSPAEPCQQIYISGVIRNAAHDACIEVKHIVGRCEIAQACFTLPRWLHTEAPGESDERRYLNPTADLPTSHSCRGKLHDRLELPLWANGRRGDHSVTVSLDGPNGFYAEFDLLADVQAELHGDQAAPGGRRTPLGDVRVRTLSVTSSRRTGSERMAEGAQGEFRYISLAIELSTPHPRIVGGA